MQSLKLLTFSVLTLVVQSCATNAPGWRGEESGIDIPGSWSATKTARAGVDREWIGRFRDKKLESLVQEAIRNNADLKAAAARVRKSAALSRLASADRLPTAQLSLTGNRNKRNFIGFPIPGRPGSGGVSSTISNTFGSSLDVSWEPDVWGKLRTAQQVSLADYQAEEAAYRAARASLAAQVAKAYFSLAEAAEQLRLTKEALEIRKKTEDAIVDRFELAIIDQGGTSSQVRLAQTDVASTKANLVQRQSALQQSRRQLELVIGRYPSGKLKGRLSLPGLPGKPPAGLPSELLTRRPDILEAERRYAASGKRVNLQKLMRYPSFSLTGSVGTSTADLKDVLNSDFGVWTLAGGIVQPILLDGRQKQRIAESKASDEENLAKLQKRILAAFGEVEDALSAEHFLTKQLAQTENALTLAKDSVVSAENDYGTGVGDILTLLAAIDRRISTASQIVSLRALQLTNRVDLHLALGGDFQPRNK